MAGALEKKVSTQNQNHDFEYGNPKYSIFGYFGLCGLPKIWGDCWDLLALWARLKPTGLHSRDSRWNPAADFPVLSLESKPLLHLITKEPARC